MSALPPPRLALGGAACALGGSERGGGRGSGRGRGRGLRVPLGVQRQVVRAREAALAVAAAERLRAGVLAVVSRQLVGPGEPPVAALPRAFVRLFSWNGSSGIRINRGDYDKFVKASSS